MAKVEYTEGSFMNSRGKKLVTSSWVPAASEPKGLILFCHGYTCNASKYFYETGQKLAEAGFAVYALDYEGHGKSEGVPGLVTSLDDISEDCATFFNSITADPKLTAKPKFVVGESLGGGVALALSHKNPATWTGAVLMAPLFQMALPPVWIENCASWLAENGPEWQTPFPMEIAQKGLEDPEKAKQFLEDPLIYHGNHRVQSIYALGNACAKLQEIAPEMSVPVLILHGESDLLLEASASKVLLDTVSSKDKTLKLYPGMFHLLIEGAPPHHAEPVMKDVMEWLESKL